MSKTQQSNKETKKQAVLSPKEKKAAKQSKKETKTSAPLMTKGG
jgi:ribosomal protein S25